MSREQDAAVAPTIHLNGSNADALRDAIREAYGKICEAHRALSDTAPNGRDYYTQGPEAIRAATRSHVNRLGALRTIERELLELHEAISAQVKP